MRSSRPHDRRATSTDGPGPLAPAQRAGVVDVHAGEERVSSRRRTSRREVVGLQAHLHRALAPGDDPALLGEEESGSVDPMTAAIGRIHAEPITRTFVGCGQPSG